MRGLLWAVRLLMGRAIHEQEMVCRARLLRLRETVQRNAGSTASRAPACRTSSARSWCRWKKSSEMKSGQKNISERNSSGLCAGRDGNDRRHLAPGKEHAKVTGFIGGTSTKPTPISEKEVQNILHPDPGKASRNRGRRCCSKSANRCASRRSVHDFHGNVEDVNYDKQDRCRSRSRAFDTG